ncbi:sphingomyelin phosphodiesterase [Nocardia sp. NPDC052566]|uniref:sphingomyelin phosphodiesterase n=1 Tax=Nocardia sp. NPDC052566 TaxID=3364330 RepID=UPI0037C989BB
MPLTKPTRLSIIAALATTLMATAPQASAAPDSTPALKVLTYNVFLMSKNLYPNWGQDHRAAEIPKTDFFKGNDVVVLQEMFDNGSSDALKAQASAEYPHQTPVVGRSKSGWDATGGKYSVTTPEDGGVTILSKWPVLRKEQFVYADACGADWWSNKGFAYVVLSVNGTKVHVVGTHTQSTDSGCSAGEAARDRALQFKEIDNFLKAKNIPSTEQVLIAGDLNVDSRSTEYNSMLTDANLEPATSRTGHQFSFDTKENSIAADRYPNDPREDLDYILYRKGHPKPATWQNRVIQETTPAWTVTSQGKTYTYTNLSDHYPVVAS